MKVSVRLALLLVFCVLFFSGEALSAPKGKLVIVQGGDLSTLDPQKMGDNYTRASVRFPFDSLVKRVFKDGKILQFPMLATSWESINETTWIFRLRKGVKFHNGEDFNAEAVKYTIERILDPAEKAINRFYFAFIDHVEIVDPYTVKIFTKGPAPLLVHNLAYTLAILAPKYYKEKGSTYVANYPVGTGPFKFVRWVKDSEVVFEANEDYWAGPPKIKTLIIKPIPEDSTRVAALLGGDADIVKKIPAHLIPMINASGRAKVEMVPAALGIFCPIETLNEGPLRDKRVRQAINYGVDKETIIKKILEGHGTALASPLSPAIFGYDPSLKPYPYDPKKAKTLLKEAGYGNGLTLTFNTPSGRYDKDKEFAEAIAGQLAEVGINVKLQVHEWGTYTQKINAGKLQDMYTMGQAASFDADSILWKFFHSSSEPIARWSDKKSDGLLEQGRSTLDREKREKIYHQALRFLHEEAPALFLFSGVDAYGVSHRVQNWKPTPDEGGDSLYVYEAWVKD